MITKSNQSGFTLIEALVSVAIFAVVVAMASVLYLSVTNAQRKTVNQEEIMREVRQVMETMSREIRLAGVDNQLYLDGECSLPAQLCLAGGQGYWFDEENQRIMSGFPGFPITSDEIQVENLSFYVNPAPDGVMVVPTPPTRVTILLTVSRQGNYGTSDQMQVQTTVSLREYSY